LIFIFAMVMVALRCVSRTEMDWQRDYRHRQSTITHTSSRPVYQIPMNCPSCQRSIELDRVEWRDRDTIVCSGCFADIKVDSSY
jgi:hypothetical protein